MRALMMLLALPLIGACQGKDSWQAFPIGDRSCGALRISVTVVQAYCYMPGNVVMGDNHVTQPITVGHGEVLVYAPKGAQYEVGDPFQVPVGGVRWEFSVVPTGIKWVLRLATPGGADIVTSIPKSYEGVFTAIYGAK